MSNYSSQTGISVRLIKEAIRQSSVKGVGNVSAKSVVRAVGCSDRLIQYYFTSVESMWTQAVRYCQNAIYEAFKTFLSANVNCSLFDIWRFAYRYSAAHYEDMTFYYQVKLMGLYSYEPDERTDALLVKALKTAMPNGARDDFEARVRMEFICDAANHFASRVIKGELPSDEESVRLYMNITFGLASN